MKNRFIELLKSTERIGIEKLIEWLETTDFFTAPASSKFHGAQPMGLLEHSLAVYDNLIKIIQYDNNSMIIAALLHDICKADFYIISYRNVKNEETGKWEKQSHYTIDDHVPLGHGEKSVILSQIFIRLSIDEMMAIRWHMGAWGATDYADRQALNKAMKKWSLVLALQIADQSSTYLDGK